MIRRGIAVLLAVVSLFVLTNSTLASGLEGFVTASTLYVRDQPYAESNTIHLVKMSEKVTILQKVNEWYNVICENGIKGYVYAQFISLGETDSTSGSRATTGSNPIDTANSKSTTSSMTANNLQTADSAKSTGVGIESLPNIMSIGDRGTGISSIQQALSDQGYYAGKVDGVFGQLTLQAVRKFQKDNGLVVDGVVGKATKRALFDDATIEKMQDMPTILGDAKSSAPSSLSEQQPALQGDSGNSNEVSTTLTASAKNSHPKSLDWFNEGYNLISKNKSVTIYDLNTGVVWSAKYINGSRHADIIPASASDAKKIASSKIVGSYVRRPVIVTIAGTDYAGSMYAVGHGEDSYCDYFKGVMCIHFTGSETHGTKKVDTDHQKAIDVALNASVNR